MNDSKPDPQIADPLDAEAQPAADTRAALIAHARQAFASEGYTGASIRRITSEAGANLGAVTYYFGSKRQLYAEVLVSVLGPLRERVLAAATASGSGLDRVTGVVRAFFAHLAANPDQPGLMLQEIASGRIPPDPARDIIRSVFGTVAGLVRQGQADGTIRPGDPALLALSAVAQPVYLSLVRRLTSPVLDLALQDDPERVVEHAVTFVRRGLAPEAGDPS